MIWLREPFPRGRATVELDARVARKRSRSPDVTSRRYAPGPEDREAIDSESGFREARLDCWTRKSDSAQRHPCTTRRLQFSSRRHVRRRRADADDQQSGRIGQVARRKVAFTLHIAPRPSPVSSAFFRLIFVVFVYCWNCLHAAYLGVVVRHQFDCWKNATLTSRSRPCFWSRRLGCLQTI